MLQTQNCPYCRHEANAYESFPHDEQESEQESEYESQSFVENEEREDAATLRWVRVGPGHWRVFENAIARIPEYSEEAHAYWVFRNFFESLENTTEENQPSEKKDVHIPYLDLLMRHEKTYDAGHDRGYDSA